MKSKIPSTVLTISLLTIFSALGEELPKDTKELLEKLEVFSESERQKAEARIQEKERQVAEVLNQHLERETKAGKLEAALAIKNAISTLERPGHNIADAPPPMPSNEGTPSKKVRLNKDETKWRRKTRPGWELVLRPKEEEYFLTIDGKRSPDWEVKLREDRVILIDKFGHKFLEFDGQILNDEKFTGEWNLVTEATPQ